MRIRNSHTQPVTFNLGGQSYTLAPDEELDIKDSQESAARSLVAQTDGLAFVTSTGAIELANEFRDSYSNDSGFDGDAEFVRREFIQFAQAQSSLLEGKASKRELDSLWKSAEVLFADKRDLVSVTEKLKELARKDDVYSSFDALTQIVDSVRCNTKELQIEPADLLTLNTAPISVLAAPGAGKFLEVLSMELFIDYETTAYTSVNDLVLEYSTSGHIFQITAAGFLDQTSDKRLIASSPGELAPGLDESVQLKMLTGNPSSGDSPLKLRICYRIKDALI